MRALLIAAATLSLAACGEDEGDGHADDGEHAHGGEVPSTSIEAEGCEHLADGPASMVTAGDLATTTPPAVSDDHKRYDLTLVAAEGGNVGRVEFASDEAGEHSFFLNTQVPFVVKSADGVALTVDHTHSSSTLCDEVQLWSIFTLGVGTYWLEVGPTEVTGVGLVIEAGHGHAE
jgi:hypothetical protein